MNDDSQDDAVGGFSRDAKFLRHNDFAFELGARPHLLHRLVARLLRRQNLIFFGQTISRVHDPIRHLTVVGE
jgi:hypothetical protein